MKYTADVIMPEFSTQRKRTLCHSIQTRPFSIESQIFCTQQRNKLRVCFLQCSFSTTCISVHGCYNSNSEGLVVYFIHVFYTVFSLEGTRLVGRLECTQFVNQQIILCQPPLSRKYCHCCCQPRQKRTQTSGRFVYYSHHKSFNNRDKNMVCNFIFVIMETLIAVIQFLHKYLIIFDVILT